MSFGKNLQYLHRLSAYKTLMNYMKVNGLIHDEKEAGIIPCFVTDGENMDVYIACK